LALIALQFANEGGTIVTLLASTLIFATYEIVDEIHCTYIISLIVLPECFTWLFGLFTDSVKIGGTKIKGHLLIASAMQCIIGILLCVNSIMDYEENEKDGIYVTLALCMLLTAMKTWMTPVIETMMVVEMKKDIARGAEDAITYSYFFYAIGSLFYGLGASLTFYLITIYCVPEHHEQVLESSGSDSETCKPHLKGLFFILPAILGLIIFITTLTFSETNQEDAHVLG